MAGLPALLIPADVAAWLELPRARVERLAEQGELPSVRLPGGERRFLAEDLRAWLDAHAVPVAATKHLR